MSYEEIEEKLRMGDVLEGLVSSVTSIKNPFLGVDNNELSLNVMHGKYHAILTPCCSIGKESSLGNDVITITPLVKLNPSFLRNPFIRDNFCLINKEMSAEQAVPPEEWKNMAPKEKQERINQGNQYAFSNYFIYESHTMFPEYDLTYKGETVKTRNYMIDFKNLSVIEKRPIKSLFEAKRLQLSILSRNELREKLAVFFGEVPSEDIVITAD
jgi:hypothetical protein